jgi:hypothetical protein
MNRYKSISRQGGGATGIMTNTARDANVELPEVNRNIPEKSR